MINKFITQIDKELFQVVVDLKLYSKEVISETCYKFTGKYYVHQQTSPESEDLIIVSIESKDGSVASEDIVKQFCNELIDQQVRYITNKQYGHIRDLIVEEAFKPVSK